MSTADLPIDGQNRDVVPAGEEPRTLSMLKAIHAGTLDPKSIRREDRHQLVGHLLAEGYSTAEIAEILKVADRTIERDKKAIREANALQPDPKLAEQIAGRLLTDGDLAIQRILKAARNKSASPGAVIEANRVAYQILCDMTDKLQSLGFVPTAARRLEAELVHHLGEIPGYDEIELEVGRIRQVGLPLLSSDPQLAQQLDRLEEEARRARLAGQLDQIEDQVKHHGESDEHAE